MQKKEFVKKVAEKSGAKIVEVERMVSAFIEVIAEAFNNGERVELRGFGNFIKKSRKARKARNLISGEVMDIPAKDVLTFKVSSLFNQTKK